MKVSELRVALELGVPCPTNTTVTGFAWVNPVSIVEQHTRVDDPLSFYLPSGSAPRTVGVLHQYLEQAPNQQSVVKLAGVPITGLNLAGVTRAGGVVVLTT